MADRVAHAVAEFEALAEAIRAHPLAPSDPPAMRLDPSFVPAADARGA